jgi:signal transduction histidine kinase
MAQLDLLLASGVHELKNQMAVLFALISELRSSPHFSSSLDKDMSKIESSMDMLQNQMHTLLLNFKSQEDALSPYLEPCAIQDLFDDCLFRHEVTLGLYHCEIEACSVQDLYCEMDEYLISNILDTLIFNSLKAGATQLKLTALPWRQGVCLQLEDNGSGFECEFNTDFQSKKDTFQCQNFGLGLSLAQKICEKHQRRQLQGRLEMGQGTLGGAMVRLYLP